jgi:hypothetical protein
MGIGLFALTVHGTILQPDIMRVSIVTSHDGKILGMAHCQLIVDGNRYPDEAEIHASQPRSIPSNGTTPRESEQLHSHIVEFPEHLTGKSFEDLQKMAYLDTRGDQPVLRLHRNSEEK